MFEACGRTGDLVGFRCHFLELLNPTLDCLAGAARLLDCHVAEIAVRAHAAAADQVRNLHDFAAQAQQENACEIRVAGIALQGPEQGVVALVIARHAAAGTVDDRHDTIDVFKIVEPALFLGCLGDEAGHRAGTVHRGENAEIVAGADAAVSAVVAHEMTLFAGGRKRPHFGRKFLRLGVAAHAEIVDMNMCARCDGTGRDSNGLAIADDLLTLGDWP